MHKKVEREMFEACSYLTRTPNESQNKFSLDGCELTKVFVCMCEKQKKSFKFTGGNGIFRGAVVEGGV